MQDIWHSLRLHRDDPLIELEVFTSTVLSMKARASTKISARF